MYYGIEDEPHLGGWWTIDQPYGDPGTWCPEIWDTLIDYTKITSIVDIGCGRGFSSKYFSDKGLEVTAIEGGSNAIKNSVFNGNLIHHDYTKGPILKNDYGLAWCCEFVEHVEEKYADNFLADFYRAKYIAMTFADVGQPGYHHVNCQAENYWMDKIDNLNTNYTYDKYFSNNLREIAIKTNANKEFPHGGHLTRLLFFYYNK